MKNWKNTREALLAIPVPEQTKTYSPISHSVCIQEVIECLQGRGYSVVEERYLSSKDGQMMVGTLRLYNGYQSGLASPMPELAPCITIVNSYNKTRKASIQVSAMVLICKNGLMANSVAGSFVRKHNGNALQEFREHIQLVVNSLEVEFNKLKVNMEEMKNISIGKAVVSELIGDMYLNESLITTSQLEAIKKASKWPTSEAKALWDFYNECTLSFHDNHPGHYDTQHVKFHTYIQDKFDLTGKRGIYGKPMIYSTKAIQSKLPIASEQKATLNWLQKLLNQ